MKNLEQKIYELTEAVNSGDNKKRYVEIGIVTKKEVEKIKQHTNLNTNGYKRIIDTYSLKHIFKSHPNIDVSDILLIPFIIKNYDFIGRGKKENTIVYKKLIGKEFFYVEEIRKGKKVLAMVTFYKRKKRKP